MAKEKINIRFGILCAMILLAAFSRVVPHMPNFSPLGAVGLFGAAHFSKKWQAFPVPIAATWLSDLYINNVVYARYYPAFTWFYQGFYWQYSAYLCITLMGIFVFGKINPQRVVLGALCGSAIFFLVSNFGCWYGNDMYAQNLSGLLACYAAGIPFLKGTVAGDLFYSALLFGTFALAQNRFPTLRRQHVRT